MNLMYLRYFTQDTGFPFFIQYGHHEEDVFMHAHADFSELVIVLNGTAMHYVNDESYFIKKGDVFVLGDGVVHGFKSTNQLKICNIMFHPDLLSDERRDIRKLPGYHALFVIEPFLAQKHDFQSHLSLQLENFEQIQSLIKIMIQEYKEQKDGCNTLLSSYFMILVTMLSRLYSMPDKKENANAINIAKSVSYMEQNFTQPVSLTELADMSHLSTRHFSRLFTATYHTTPGNYMLSLRLQHACHLLKDPEYTIGEVASASGFNDSNYFSRQFHNFYGISPSQYRRN